MKVHQTHLPNLTNVRKISAAAAAITCSTAVAKAASGNPPRGDIAIHQFGDVGGLLRFDSEHMIVLTA